MTLPQEIQVRAFLEMAEGAHPGPIRAYAEFLKRYITEVEALAGSDEHICSVCGVPNVKPDGTDRLLFIGFKGIWFCREHVGLR